MWEHTLGWLFGTTAEAEEAKEFEVLPAGSNVLCSTRAEANALLNRHNWDVTLYYGGDSDGTPAAARRIRYLSTLAAYKSAIVLIDGIDPDDCGHPYLLQALDSRRFTVVVVGEVPAEFAAAHFTGKSSS